MGIRQVGAPERGRFQRERDIAEGLDVGSPEWLPFNACAISPGTTVNEK